MKKRLLLASLLALSLLALLLAGPETPAQNPQPVTPEPPGQEATEGEPLEVFEPTEKLSADSAVSFPVDI